MRWMDTTPPASSSAPSSPPKSSKGDKALYYTASDLAELCGVDFKTIHNWVDKNLFPTEAVFRTPGRHLRFHPAPTLAWIGRQGYAIPEEMRAAAGAIPTPAAPFVAQALLDVKKMVERLPALPEREDLEKILTLLKRAVALDPTIAVEVEILEAGKAK